MGDEVVITRYEVVDCEKCGDVATDLEPDEEGSWVLADDHLSALRQVERETWMKAASMVVAMQQVCDEVMKIMRTYHEQEASDEGVATPGGLEHMGDVWRLFHTWEALLRRMP